MSTKDGNIEDIKLHYQVGLSTWTAALILDKLALFMWDNKSVRLRLKQMSCTSPLVKDVYESVVLTLQAGAHFHSMV